MLLASEQLVNRGVLTQALSCNPAAWYVPVLCRYIVLDISLDKGI